MTLTYNDENLPGDSLPIYQNGDFQKFMKRLRKDIAPKKIKFFACGEYGEACRMCRLPKRECTCSVFDPWLGRPHYHVLVFGFDFPDKYHWRTKGNNKLFRSPTLEKLWPFGNCEIGSVTFESAAYVARYVTKKVNGEMADDHYDGRLPEYCTMSRRPGIAAGWFDKYKSEVFPSDSVVVRGVLTKPPKYYDRLLEKENPSLLELMKNARVKKMKEKAEDNTLSRLAVKEKIKLHQISSLRRALEVEK